MTHSRPRVLCVHPYLDGRRPDCARGLYPRSHLWGADVLEELGWQVDWLEKPAAPTALGRRLRGLTRDYFGDFDYARAIRRRAREADIVYIVTGEYPLVRVARRFGRLRVPVVMWVYAPRRAVPFRKARRLFQLLPDGWGLDGVLALTPFTEDAFRRQNYPGRLLHLRWIADGDLFRPAATPGNYLFTCGKTARDYPTFFAAAAQADVPVRVIAPRTALPAVLPPQVQHAGGPETAADDRGVDYPTLTALLAGARACVIPLPHDPHTPAGLTNLLEALAAGVPVVMTRTGHLPFDLEAQGLGLYAPPGDVGAMAAVLRRIALDDALHARLRANVLAFRDQLCDRRHFGQEISRHLGEVLAATGSRAAAAVPAISASPS